MLRRWLAYYLRNYSEWGRVNALYRLEEIPSAPTILDIGAGVGLFAVAARRNFPGSIIHCYEPSRQLFPVLRQRAFSVNAMAIQQTIDPESFREAVDRLGRVGLLKIGRADQKLFEDHEIWKSINRVVMKHRLDPDVLRGTLYTLGFRRIEVNNKMAFASRGEL